MKTNPFKKTQNCLINKYQNLIKIQVLENNY